MSAGLIEGLEPVAAVLRALADGKLPGDLPPSLPLREELAALVAYWSEIQSLALDASRGTLEPRVIRARGPVAGSLKALQASLRHLTWQTQRVAAGDLTQRAEFLGEFSASFNRMVEQLAEGRRYEVQLRQAQRAEAVGQLAAGLAHEINTPAQFVGDSLHFLQETLAGLGELIAEYRRAWAAGAQANARASGEESIRAAEEKWDVDYLLEQAPEATQRALDGLKRIASIIEAIQEFASREPRRRIAPADLNHAISTTLTVASHELTEVAEISTQLEPLPEVVCDVHEIRQALLNLLVNAAWAIRDAGAAAGSRGRIVVGTRQEGDSVRISIADTGCGIPEPIRERIYDPFFTTRPVGQGRGQGLTTVHQIIVERHRGAISFETETGKGTTFMIQLPLDGILATAAGGRP